MVHVLAENRLWWMLVHPAGNTPSRAWENYSSSRACEAGGAVTSNCPGGREETCWQMGPADHYLLQVPDAGEASALQEPNVG